jgi:eukaryotic-like serine/threonine-protein kinase
VLTGLKHCPTCNLRYPPEAERCIVDRALLTLIPDPLLGSVIAGKYRIEGILGAGGMATVYRARALVQEATSTQRLVHPNIIAILDQGETEDGIPFMVMEFLAGQTIEAQLRKTQGPLPAYQVIDWMHQIATGLARAHDFQVIHRDLKPDNLYVVAMTDGTERIKILDFGIARYLLDSRLTGTGEIFGTPQYMAPERITGTEAGPSADLYALGCVMFRCATGRLPFQAADVTAYLVRHLRESAPSARSINPEVPPELDELISLCLAKKPEHRPADARALERTLAVLTEKYPRPREVRIAPTPVARLVNDAKATVAGGLFSVTSIERWGRRIELLGTALQRAFPKGAESRHYAALGRLRATVTAMAEVHAQWFQEQTRADGVAERTRESQQRFGFAMDALAADLHTAREARNTAQAWRRDLHTKQSVPLERFVIAHTRVVEVGISPTPSADLVVAYREALSALENALPQGDALAAAHQEVERCEGDVRDLAFQIESLRVQMEKLSQTAEEAQRISGRRLEIAATQLSSMESEIVKDASELSSAMRHRSDLRDLFALMDAES